MPTVVYIVWSVYTNTMNVVHAYSNLYCTKHIQIDVEGENNTLSFGKQRKYIKTLRVSNSTDFCSVQNR